MEDNWKSFQETLAHTRERRRRRRRTAFVLFSALVLAGYGAAHLRPLFEGPEPRPEKNVAIIPTADSCRDVLCKIPWPTFRLGEGDGYEERVEGHRIRYTVDPELQEGALTVFRRYKVPYGAFVAIEPSSGKILALAEYSAQEPELGDFCRRATYPAASLVKIMTAVAALESGKVTPATQFRFEGSPYRLYPRKISPKNGRRENNVSTLADALGKSNNVVFGKLGADVVGAEGLERALAAFGFNVELPFDFPLQRSHATVPRERFPLARTAAGFEDVYLSPVHAAMIAAAVGNGGLMMQPYVVETIEDENGKTVYRAAPAPFRQCTEEGIAKQVGEMMVRTVSGGTSSKVFYRYARKLRSRVGVAGKTGSLTGQDPPGKYEWFVGFAPVTHPKIAVASLVVNQGDLWHIKGTYTAQAVMREFFGM